ncbi:MAG: class I SAM-dependent methyltransferase [Acidiferrobacterales bacterium]
MLDVGCGTGTLLQVLSAASPSVKLSGVDPSPEMLGIAHAKLGCSAELKPGYAEKLPFRDETFDIVASTSTFHYLRRPKHALREIARVLKPRGEIVITDWCADYLTCYVCDRLLCWFNRAHVKTHGRDECQRLLEESGFQSVDVDRYRINWLWGLMTARAQKFTTQTVARTKQSPVSL